jgi:SAM-dependent methyltransferase
VSVPPKEIRDYYEEEALALANHQKMMYFGDPWNDYWHLTRLREIMKIVRKTSFDSFLDVGCAEGLCLKLLSKNSRTRSSGSGLDLAKNYLLKARVASPKSLLVQGDASQLPFKNDIFDLVLCSEVLEHVPNPKNVFKELVRVSRRYIVVTLAGENLFYFVMRKFGLVRTPNPYGEPGHGHINEDRISQTVIPWSLEIGCKCIDTMTTSYFPAHFLRSHRMPSSLVFLVRLADKIINNIPILSEFGATQIAFLVKQKP